MHRAYTGWPMGSVPYSQSTRRGADGYRQDCSGYAAMALGIPPGQWGGPNTATFVSSGLIHKIDPNDLRPGDLVGLCGPGSEGDNGHIQVFVAWFNSDPNDSRYYCLEQTGGGSGPNKRLHDWPNGYAAYRYRDIQEDPAAPPPPPPPPHIARPYPLPAGHFFGPLADPRAWIHGGYNGWEQPAVRDIQVRLQQSGDAPNVPGWADGRWDPPTTPPVQSFQGRHGLVQDGLVGPITWAQLFA